MKNSFHKHKIENLIVVPKIVTIHYLELDKNYVFKGEAHDFWELVYADKEDVICNAEDNEFELFQGEIIFHKPNEFHSIRSNKKQPPNIAVITFECKSDAMRYFENKKLALPPELRIYIYNIIKEARQTFMMGKQNPNLRKMQLLSSPVLGGQQLIRLNLEQLLINLLRLGNKKNALDIFISRDEFENNLVNRVIELLKNNIYGNLMVDDICQQMNYGKSYLYNLFKNQTGHSIKNYYINLKIDAAKKMMRSGSFSSNEIADRLCFATPSYFCKVFKKLTGMTSSQYRETINI